MLESWRRWAGRVGRGPGRTGKTDNWQSRVWGTKGQMQNPIATCCEPASGEETSVSAPHPHAEVCCSFPRLDAPHMQQLSWRWHCCSSLLQRRLPVGWYRAFGRSSSASPRMESPSHHAYREVVPWLASQPARREDALPVGRALTDSLCAGSTLPGMPSRQRTSHHLCGALLSGGRGAAILASGGEEGGRGPHSRHIVAMVQLWRGRAAGCGRSA